MQAVFPLGFRLLVVVLCEPPQNKKVVQEKATSVVVAACLETASGFASASICNKCSFVSAARFLNPLYGADTKTRIKPLTTHICCLINAPLWFCLLCITNHYFCSQQLTYEPLSCNATQGFIITHGILGAKHMYVLIQHRYVRATTNKYTNQSPFTVAADC